MGKFLVKIGKKLIEFNKYLKSKWNSLMYALMFKSYNEKCNCEDKCICKKQEQIKMGTIPKIPVTKKGSHNESPFFDFNN